MQKTRDEAAAECCKYGLQLATIESLYELECFADMNNCKGHAKI